MGPRRRPWRALVFVGAAALMVGLAFVVARPRVEPAAAVPYAGVRGASRDRASGLKIFYRRGGEVQVLAPGTPLRAGDALRFVVRGERPRYLVVELRDAGQAAATVFPTGAQAALVRPGDTLPVTPALGPGMGRAVVTALYADRPFPVGAPPGPDTETVSIVIDKTP